MVKLSNVAKIERALLAPLGSVEEKLMTELIDADKGKVVPGAAIKLDDEVAFALIMAIDLIRELIADRYVAVDVTKLLKENRETLRGPVAELVDQLIQETVDDRLVVEADGLADAIEFLSLSNVDVCS